MKSNPWAVASRVAAPLVAMALIGFCYSQILHLVFGLFFALLFVCAVRGISLHLYHAFKSSGRDPASIEVNPASVPTAAT